MSAPETMEASGADALQIRCGKCRKPAGSPKCQPCTQANPLSVACPKCSAPVAEACLRTENMPGGAHHVRIRHAAFPPLILDGQTKLEPCPFCHRPLYIRQGVNAYGQCETRGCWTHDRKVTVSLSDPYQVAQWNRRGPDAAQP